jgi:FkbM family methyltransferase
MQRLKDYIKKIIHNIVPPPYVPASYAQAGEDVIMNFLFIDYGIKSIRYLDIGTNNPSVDNNTYLFYKNGGTGICIEADQTLIKNIRSVRPKDKVINAGVSVSNEKEADFYLFKGSSLNTFDKKEAEYRESFGKHQISNIVKVPLVNINDLIKNNFDTYPDLISLDIEGLDLEVLQSLNLNEFPIPVICVETCTYSENHIRPKNHSIAEFMLKNGYEIYADTYINTIFVNKKWFYNK